MKANELRIGNIVLYNGYNIGEVHGISSNKFGIGIHIHFKDHAIGCAEECITGIPLTEEWLVRLGFKEKDRIYKNDRIEINIWNHGTVHIIGSNGVYSIPYQHGKHSIHWLQNLYFALTGEELTIKPESK